MLFPAAGDGPHPFVHGPSSPSRVRDLPPAGTLPLAPGFSCVEESQACPAGTGSFGKEEGERWVGPEPTAPHSPTRGVLTAQTLHLPPSRAERGAPVEDGGERGAGAKGALCPLTGQ